MKLKNLSTISFVATVFLCGVSAIAQQQINLASLKNGGSVVSFPERNNPAHMTPLRFLTESQAAGKVVWTGGQNGPPLDFVFSFRGMCPATITSFVLQQAGADLKNTEQNQIRDFKIEVSDTSPVSGFRTLGQFTLMNKPGPQTFTLPTPESARFLKMRVLSNRGGKFTVLGGEIKIMGSPRYGADRDCGESGKETSQKKISSTSAADTVNVLKAADLIESESNDTIASANQIRPGQSIGGSIEKSGEADYFSLRLRPEERGIVNLTLESRPFLRTDMELLDKNGKALTRIGNSEVLGLKKSYSLNLDDEQYYFKLYQPGMSIVLLVDNSGSMKGRENELRRAVEQFVSERNESDSVAILNFAGGPTGALPSDLLSKLPKEVRSKLPKTFLDSMATCTPANSCKPLGGGVGELTDFTSDQNVLKAAAANTARAFGGTPLNRAMITAFEKLEKKEGNKAILLFSDGADTASLGEYSQVWELIAEELGVRIYTVGLGNAMLQMQGIGITGRNLMRHWSLATNGRSFFTTNPAELTDFYAQISREIGDVTKYRLEIGTAKGKGTLDLIARGERLPAEITSRRVELVFDASGSMHAKVGEKTRIEIAKEVVKDLIDKLPEETEIGMRVFGHRRKGDCKDIEMVAPFSRLDKVKLTSQVEAIDAIGITPLADSLRMVASDMAGYSGDTTLIVLTDGNEQCKGDPVAEVKKLQRQGIDVNLHIIGFAVDDKSVSQLNEIAKAGDGQFHMASDSEELVSALRTSLGARFEVRDATGKVVAKGVTGAKDLRLTEGYYRVVIKSDPEIVVKDVYIKNGETTTVIVTKEGTEINTEVRAPEQR